VSASVIDDDNAAVSGASVDFTSTGGVLSAGNATTDESGIAEVTFSSGYLDKSNQQVVITAEVDGLTADVPVSIAGTTCEIAATQTSLVIGGENTDTMVITVTDAGGNPIYDAEVSLSLASGSTGSLTFSVSSGTTDMNGLFQATVTGSSPGTAIVSVSAAGATAVQEYEVTASSVALAITSPSTDPASMSTSQTLNIVVSNPTPGSSNQVVLATTVGTLSYGGDSGSALTLDVSGGQVQASLSSAVAGTATITAFDIDSPSVTDTLMVAIHAPISDADQLALQADSSVVAVSDGATTNTVEITASVVNSTDEGIGNAPVMFTLSDTTGGGEHLSPSIVFTDASGSATTTFYSGTKSSGAEGVTVEAFLLSDETINDNISIIIGGTAGSVVLGVSSKIESVYDDTAYQFNVSVIVADTNGNPIPNQSVSLSLWPTDFAVTVVDEEYDISDDTTTYTYTNFWFDNEDTDRNTFLDPGEDIYFVNGLLDPGNSAGGTIPAAVVTDENGVATFTWTYLKSYGRWVAVDLSASTFVLGSETATVLNVTLPIMDGDEDDLNPYSPWYVWNYTAVP
jgi:hypothetical protein